MEHLLIFQFMFVKLANKLALLVMVIQAEIVLHVHLKDIINHHHSNVFYHAILINMQTIHLLRCAKIVTLLAQLVMEQQT